MADCNWNTPGADPFRGADPAQAVVAYGFPKPAQVEILEKLRRIDPDARVTISRDGIVSGTGEVYDLRDMHFGRGRLCRGPVVRDAWAPDVVQEALVYCSSIHCIAVPVICGNISRITFVHWPPYQPTLPPWSASPPTMGTRPPAGPVAVPPARPPALPGSAPATVHEVPEPGSWLLVGLGLGLLALTRRKNT